MGERQPCSLIESDDDMVSPVFGITASTRGIVGQVVGKALHKAWRRRRDRGAPERRGLVALDRYQRALQIQGMTVEPGMAGRLIKTMGDLHLTTDRDREQALLKPEAPYPIGCVPPRLFGRQAW